MSALCISRSTFGGLDVRRFGKCAAKLAIATATIKKSELADGPRLGEIGALK